MHIHLDLVGGISGDMFIGVLLDCFPERRPELDKVMVDAGFASLVQLESAPADDGVLTGTHFKVLADSEAHQHRQYSEIRSTLASAALAPATLDAALGIFDIIAVAEANIHGVDVADVTFHEVGAWDSIADVVCAAHLISQSDVASWSVSRLPIGRGQIRTAHGLLPVPAPATSLMLEGFEFFDDGLEGERVTPTGAAILKYLEPDQGIPSGVSLGGSGIGFGTKKFDGISNVVRALVFNDGADEPWQSDQVLQLEFEVDDQTPEALAVALDQLRCEDGVLDVLQTAYMGKKGRQATSIRILAAPQAEQRITSSCFRETTTLGVRRQLVRRSTLSRQQIVVEYEGQDFRVKVSDRPGGKTAKVEMDDLQTVSITRREHVRRQVEKQVLDKGNE